MSFPFIVWSPSSCQGSLRFVGDLPRALEGSVESLGEGAGLGRLPRCPCDRRTDACRGWWAGEPPFASPEWTPENRASASVHSTTSSPGCLMTPWTS